MIQIPITKQMLETAKAYQDKVLANLPKVDNHTGLTAQNRYMIGSLGEQAVVKILKDNNKRFEYHPKADGKSDQGDITIWYGNLDLTVDVKTGGNENIQYMYIPMSQYNRKRYPIYIGCRINKPNIEVWGYAPPEQLRVVPSKIDSIGKEFELLKPVEKLIEKLS